MQSITCASVESEVLCPICEHAGPFRRITEPEVWIGEQYFRSLRGRLAVSVCENCYTHITTPRPGSEILEGFYSLPGYPCHSSEIKSNPALTLDRVTPGRYENWLDFGCGWGALLEAARKRGYDARGIEVGKLARASLSERGLLAYANLDECGEAGFRPDVVSLIHALEHIAHPRVLLEAIHSLMNPEGLLIIEVPNLRSMRARAGFLFPKKRYPNAQKYCAFPIHLVYYTIDSLSRLLKCCGYAVVATGSHGFGLEIFDTPAAAHTGVAKPTPLNSGGRKKLQSLRNAVKVVVSRLHLGEHIHVIARPL